MVEEQDEDNAFVVMPGFFKDWISDLPEAFPPRLHFGRQPILATTSTENLFSYQEDGHHPEEQTMKRIGHCSKTTICLLQDFLQLRSERIRFSGRVKAYVALGQREITFHAVIMVEDQDEDNAFVVMPAFFKDRISDLPEAFPPRLRLEATHFGCHI
ncbi:hypothetical protein PTKIN_Ptkin06aG0203900 [Pterospermum kingtungense]